MKNIFFPLLWNNNFFMNVMSRFLNDSGALLSRSKRQNIRKNSYRCLFLYLVYIQSICIEEYFVTFFLNNNFFVNTLLPLKIVFLSENNLTIIFSWTLHVLCMTVILYRIIWTIIFAYKSMKEESGNLVTRVSLHLEVERLGNKVSRDRG